MKATPFALVMALVALGCGSKDTDSASASATAEKSAAPHSRASSGSFESDPTPEATGSARENKHAGGCSAATGPCDGEGTLSSGGKDRTFLVHFPKSKGQKPGLMIALHGHGGTAKEFKRGTHFDKLANEAGYGVIYPQGFQESWDAYAGKDAAAKAGVDDVAFISALIDHAVNDLGADPAQVIVGGFSNGGMMSQRIGCELADKVMAIAPASGLMAAAEGPVCAPAKPISVIMFQGDADKTMLFNGKPESDKGPKLFSAPETIAKWATLNKCDPKPVVTDEPDTDPNDGTKVKRSTYKGCANDVHVVFFKVEGGVHAWPSGPSTEKKSEKEGISHDIDAGKLILELAKPG